MKIRLAAIPITPSMIKAGVETFLDHDREADPSSEIVRSVFLAMLKARDEQ